jgi:alkylation response protein AidB-like acyl-CoA dehydrogenase
MIGFELTDEQREFRDLAHRFAEKTIRPVAAEADEREELPLEVLEKAHQTGLLSYQIPEAYGGGGVTSLLTRTLIDEELFWGCAGLGSTIGGVGLCVAPLMLVGTEEQKMMYLSRFCDPNKITLGAFAITEPSAGSDAGGIKTHAQRKGDKYILNGTKTFITNGGVADIYIVFATQDPEAGTKGICAFIVEKGWPGVSFGAKEKKLGIRASQTANVILEDVEVPIENRLGEEGEGFSIAMRTFDITRTHVAAGGVGIARAAHEYALQYALERKQFNRQISRFQAISFMLADMATEIDAARLLVWRAAWLHDQGKPFTKESSMAKARAGDMAVKVTTDAVQILGGYGYIREYPVEKWMRDAKIMQIYEGTAQIQRLIIARQLVKAATSKP